MTTRMKFTRNVNNDGISWLSDEQSSPANFWISTVLLVIVLAISSNYVTIDGTFIFDDRESVLKNKDVYNLSTTIKDVFGHDFWGADIASNVSHKSYRPLTIMVFRIQHHLAGQLDPRLFHMFNIGMHVFNSLLSLLVIVAILSDGEPHELRPETREGIILASLLFAVHPIHTESVASIVGQADMLYTLFSLAAFLLYHYALTQDKKQIDNSFLPNLKYILGVSFLTIVSLLCKEQGLMTTVMCALYDILLHQKEICKFVTPQVKQKGFNSSELSCKDIKNKILSNVILRLCSLAAVTSILLLFRLYLMKSQPIFSVHDNPQSFVEDFTMRVLNYCYLYLLNAWILLNPWWLCCDWSNNCVPILDSFQDFRFLVLLPFFTILLLIAFTALRFANTPRSRKLLAAAIFLFIPFLPASNIFFRVGFVIAERNLYLPCLGFSLIVALGYSALSKHISSHHLQNLRKSAIFLIAIYTIRSHMLKCLLHVFGFPKEKELRQIWMHAIKRDTFTPTKYSVRNKEWLQSDTLFRSGLNVCPNNAKLYFNIGMGYLCRRDLNPAKQYFYETIQKNPHFASAYNGLGDCYLDEGNLTLAEEFYQKAVNISVNKEGPLLNLCYILFKLKKMAEARECIDKIISQYPSSADRGYYGLAEIFYQSGDEQRALEAWIKATEVNSSYTEAWKSVIVSLSYLGRHEESEKMFHKSLPLVPNPAALHHIWGRLHESKHYYIGEEQFKKALEYEPYNPTYREKIVSFYKSWKRSDLAMTYLKAFRESPISG